MAAQHPNNIFAARSVGIDVVRGIGGNTTRQTAKVARTPLGAVSAELEDELLHTALQLADYLRRDVPAAHRITAQLDRLELEQVCCVLAALVDPDWSPTVAWWRTK